MPLNSRRALANASACRSLRSMCRISSRGSRGNTDAAMKDRGRGKTAEPDAMVKNLFVQVAVWFAFMAALLFGAAGTLHWAAGWWFLLEWAVLGLWLGVWLARHDPALLAERLKPIV